MYFVQVFSEAPSQPWSVVHNIFLSLSAHHHNSSLSHLCKQGKTLSNGNWISFIGQFVHLIGRVWRGWVDGGYRYFSQLYLFIRSHLNLVQHPSNYWFFFITKNNWDAYNIVYFWGGASKYKNPPSPKTNWKFLKINLCGFYYYP